MTGKVIELRRATERPIRIAKMVAIGTATVVVVGGVAIVFIGARHRAERKSLKRRVAHVVDAAANPAKTAKQAARVMDKSLKEAREKARAELRAELRQELEKELKEKRPMRERILATALRSAASAAVPIVLKQLEQRRSAGPNGKGATATGKSAGSPRP